MKKKDIENYQWLMQQQEGLAKLIKEGWQHPYYFDQREKGKRG